MTKKKFKFVGPLTQEQKTSVSLSGKFGELAVSRLEYMECIYEQIKQSVSDLRDSEDVARTDLQSAKELLGRVISRGPTRGDGLLIGDILSFLGAGSKEKTVP